MTNVSSDQVRLSQAAFYQRRHELIVALIDRIRSRRDISPALAEFAEVWASNSIGGISLKDFQPSGSLGSLGLVLSFAKGLFRQLAISIVERLIYGSPGNPAFAEGEEVFVGILRRDNGTRRICSYLEKSRPSHFFFLKVGGPVFADAKWLDAPIRLGARIKVPFRFRHFKNALGDIASGWRLLKDLVSGLDQSVALRALKEKAEIFARYLVRGVFAARWAAATRGSGVVIFPILRPDLAMLDRTLRDRGHFTVHWLHGTVEHAFKFHGFSSLAVALNPMDAEVCRTFNGYARTAILPGRLPRPARAIVEKGSSVLLTNLLHPGHKLPMAALASALMELFAICRQACPGEVFWRPHPRERQSPAFAGVKARAAELGIGLDDAPTLGECLRRHPFAICTASGVIGDAVAAGTLPAVWTGVWYEEVGLWKDFPHDVLFEDAADLGRVRDYLNRPESNAVFDALWTRFHCGGEIIASPGYFKQEAARRDET